MTPPLLAPLNPEKVILPADVKPVNPVSVPVAWIFPLLLMVNFVVPEEDASMRSPLFVLLTMSAPLLPMPLLMKSGASGVAARLLPICTPE